MLDMVTQIAHETERHSNGYAEVMSSDYNSARVVSEFMAVALATRGAMGVLEKVLPAEANTVKMATGDLTDKLKTLASEVTRQGEIIHMLMHNYGQIDAGDRKMSPDQFVEFFTSVLDDAVTKLLYVSQKAISMVYSMEDVIKHLQEIETFSKNIQAVTKKTHLLALNASIEAASAGEAGKSFSVVANEVKEVSKQVSDISEQMNIRTRSISQCVMAGYDLLKDVATADMNSNMLAKETMEAMLNGLRHQAEKAKETMEKSTATSKNLADTISGMIADLQFQDRHSQVTGNAVNILHECSHLLEKVYADADAINMCKDEHSTQCEQNATQSIFSVITLEDIQFQYREVLRKIGISSAGDTLLTERVSSGDDMVLS
jgi:methyl-accepting chemotaxis protein